MFTGVNLEQALKYYLQGKEVIVIDRYSKGENGKGYDVFPFEELFENIEILANLPATENPEWNKAIQGMVEQNVSEADQTATNEEKGPERSKKEIIEELVLQGLSNREIVLRTGIKYATVWAYAKELRNKHTDMQQEDPYKGQNEDKHLCETCRFRGTGQTKTNGIGCEYAVINGHSRGCKVEDCNVYEKGNPEKRNKPLVL